MADYKSVAQLLRAVRCGANPSEVCAMANGVLFVNEGTARIVAEKYDTELVEIKETTPFRWFVKNKPGAADDPLIKVIEKALADAGL